MSSERLHCDYRPCKCEFEPHAVVRTGDGRAYCSQRCVDGRGCDHAGCNCGKFPTAEPDPARVAAPS